MPEVNLPFPQNPTSELWRKLASADLSKIASLSGAVLIGSNLQLFAVGQDVFINIGQKEITSGAGNNAPFLLQLVIMQYLLNAQDLLLADKLVNPMEFVGGDFFFRGPHAFKLKPLEEKFGSDKDSFLQAGETLGARPGRLADASLTVPALPRVPVTYALWCADEEFPAKVNVLFDATAERQLPLDMLWALVNVINKQLLS